MKLVPTPNLCVAGSCWQSKAHFGMHYLLSFEFRFEFRGGVTFVVRLTVFLRAFEISVAGQRLTENMYPKFIIVGVQATSVSDFI